MKNLITLLILNLVVGVAMAQQVGVNLRIDAAKAFKPSKQTRIEIAQQLQLNPEIKNINKRYYRVFDELELFPFLADDQDDDDRSEEDDDDDDASSGKGNQSFNELNDAAYAINLRWRSSTTFDFDYKIRKWLRLGQSYTLLIDAEDVRQLTRTDLTWKPARLTKTLELEYRIAYQLGLSREKEQWRLNDDFNSRVELEWEFKNKHVWFHSWSVNGAFEKGAWGWDRFRYDTGLEYQVSKTQSFLFGYRFQQRLDRRKNAVSHGVNIAYSLDF